MTPFESTSSSRWQRMKELYQATMEHRVEERASFLSAACGPDEELRREIERLLRESSVAGPLDQPVWEGVAGKDTREPAPQLGPYLLLEKMGAGGMGEVYKARDTRLDRTVAIKVLRGVLSEAPEFRRRFEREARATSALNHPHICTLYDLGEQGGLLYIVMEYVAGKTLAQRLRKGPLPIEQVLVLGAQIADALAAAHARGIIHRDLKPANIMLGGGSGVSSDVKILDFGLAKVESQEQDAASLSEALTASHTLVGTLSYMAPEQLEGETADARADIFALGLVLYEMASARKPFEAKSQAGTIAEVMRGEPRPMGGVPPRFERLVKRCLARDPALRWQSAADVKLELDDIRGGIADETTGGPLEAASVARRRGWSWWALAAGGLAVLLVATFEAGVFVTASDAPDQSQYSFTPLAFDPGGQSEAVWSPDGRAVAYRAQAGDRSRQVFVRRLDSEAPAQLTYIREGATPLAWSPDSHRVLLYSPRQPSGIWSIAAVGGEPERVLSIDSNRLQLPIVLAPDGNAAAWFCRNDSGIWSLCISSPLGAPPKKYSPEPFAKSEMVDPPALGFSPDGKSILLLLDNYVSRSRQAWLLRYPGNPQTPPRRVLSDLPGYIVSPTFCWLPDSRHVLLSLQPAPGSRRQLWEADVLSGKRRLAISRTGHVMQPAASPNGRRIVFTEQLRHNGIVLAALDGSRPTPLIATERNELMPDFAAEKPVLVYVTDRNGPWEIWTRSGNADRPVVTARDFPQGATVGFMGPALSPQADRVVYTRLGSDSSRLWISSTAGGALIPLTTDTLVEYPGSWSPDGSWFTYVRVNTEKHELMKVKTTGQAAPEVLKSGVKDLIPSWSPAGDWIALGDELVSPDGKSVRHLGEHGSPHYMFSKDGKLVYGIRGEGDRNVLLCVQIATGAEKLIGDVGSEFRPAGGVDPGIRFSLAPDGKSFVYAVGKTTSDLWLIEGFGLRVGLLARLGLR